MPNVLRAGQTPARPRPSVPTVFSDIESLPGSEHFVSYEDALAAVVQAQEQAHDILEAARNDARAVRAAAQEDAERVREEARRRGRIEAEAEAQAAAQEAAEAAVAAHRDTVRADVEAFCQALLAEHERLWADVQAQLTGLAVEIAERVVKAELSVNPDVAVQITRHALRRLTGCDAVRIRVNPDDVERMRDRRDEIMGLFEGLHSVEITEDRRIGLGGVQIETDSGTIDARVDTQMGEIERALG